MYQDPQRYDPFGLWQLSPPQHPVCTPPAPTQPPAAGDYGVWEAECRQLVDRWAPGFAQAGCSLSLQRHRWDGWLWQAGRQAAISCCARRGMHVPPPLTSSCGAALICRDYWLQIDVDPAFSISQPVAPPLPRVPQQAPPPAAAPGQPPADQPPLPQHYETVGGEAAKPPKAV